MNPRTVCFCQQVAVMISSRVAPFLRLIRASTWSFFVVPAAFGSFAALAGLGALVAFAFAGRDRAEAVAGIAEEILGLETLDTRNSDSLDFSEQAVWTLRAALEAAYTAGLASAKN